MGNQDLLFHQLLRFFVVKNPPITNSEGPALGVGGSQVTPPRVAQVISYTSAAETCARATQCLEAVQLFEYLAPWKKHDRRPGMNCGWLTEVSTLRFKLNIPRD